MTLNTKRSNVPHIVTTSTLRVVPNMTQFHVKCTAYTCCNLNTKRSNVPHMCCISTHEFQIFSPFRPMLHHFQDIDNFQLCLTMSAELLKSKFVRPSVASIISEVTAWITFKFQLWLPLGHMPRLFLNFLFFIFSSA